MDEGPVVIPPRGKYKLGSAVVANREEEHAERVRTLNQRLRGALKCVSVAAMVSEAV
jgi:hypothetical protein